MTGAIASRIPTSTSTMTSRMSPVRHVKNPLRLLVPAFSFRFAMSLPLLFLLKLVLDRHDLAPDVELPSCRELGRRHGLRRHRQARSVLDRVDLGELRSATDDLRRVVDPEI